VLERVVDEGNEEIAEEEEEEEEEEVDGREGEDKDETVVEVEGVVKSPVEGTP